MTNIFGRGRRVLTNARLVEMLNETSQHKFVLIPTDTVYLEQYTRCTECGYTISVEAILAETHFYCPPREGEKVLVNKELVDK